MNVAAVVAWSLIAVGSGFFLAGTVGLLRFPGVFSRLHALTKADNVGLGLLVLGLAILAGSPWTALKLAVIWALALLAGTVSCHLIARYALREQGGRERAEP
ncbi:multisubunit sodium/proton antiporter MrpG subunit [Alkalispirillum mobile]|uniref:Multisubunit sodium/proton antiporter MrpG subunit n=1 Tax=Alkalispirillum mobile TaxID=85925 RepID=A0A498C5Q6_9GAMM|nr:multisubunit sodium/proton antiporter MrpG subunit [Alkalispirillum mobile]